MMDIAKCETFNIFTILNKTLLFFNQIKQNRRAISIEDLNCYRYRFYLLIINILWT